MATNAVKPKQPHGLGTLSTAHAVYIYIYIIYSKAQPEAHVHQNKDNRILLSMAQNRKRSPLAMTIR